MTSPYPPLTKPLALIILDGLGYAPDGPHNAVSLARIPCLERLNHITPLTLLEASGSAVGLPEGQVGNSEVGHTSLGMGAKILQDLPRIDLAFAEQRVAALPVLKDFILKSCKGTKVCHLLGLTSTGGVHSHLRHLEELIPILEQAGLTLYLHAISDGRDTQPQGFDKDLDLLLHKFPNLRIATISGRFYAMDRDHRWNRTEQAVNCMLGQGPSILDSDHKSFISYIQQSYKNGQGDEFLLPVQNPDFSGIQEGDSLICFNFRPDRVRQILSVLCGQESKAVPNLSAALGFALYDPKLPMSVLFPKQMLGKGLGQALSEAGLRQLRLAETEKYPHVTYFFNGGREEPFAGEDRILIPSPKDVSTYDLKPEMSAFSVRDAALTALDQGIYDVLIINFANPDMVGHCGILSAAIAAVETVDHCLQDILDKILSLNGTALILADHGNCEVMWDAIHNCPHTSHTLNPVRAYLVGEDSLKLKSHGDLCDIAPSLLQLLHISAPAEMTGTSLIDLNPVI